MLRLTLFLPYTKNHIIGINIFVYNENPNIPDREAWHASSYHEVVMCRIVKNQEICTHLNDSLPLTGRNWMLCKFWWSLGHKESGKGVGDSVVNWGIWGNDITCNKLNLWFKIKPAWIKTFFSQKWYDNEMIKMIIYKEHCIQNLLFSLIWLNCWLIDNVKCKDKVILSLHKARSWIIWEVTLLQQLM